MSTELNSDVLDHVLDLLAGVEHCYRCGYEYPFGELHGDVLDETYTSKGGLCFKCLRSTMYDWDDYNENVGADLVCADAYGRKYKDWRYGCDHYHTTNSGVCTYCRFQQQHNPDKGVGWIPRISTSVVTSATMQTNST